MKAVLLDTNAWAWTFSRPRELSASARATISAADEVFVSPVSFFEIAQKVRVQKWPDMEPLIGQLLDVLDGQGSKIVSLDPKICLIAGGLVWPHRDPFDRMIAATALHHRLPLVSSDAVFDGLLARIW